MIYDQTWRRFGLFTGGLCIAVGASVFSLWILAPESLGARLPVIFAMKANTALAMMVLGACTLLILTGRQRLTVLPLSLVLLYGFAALFQYIAGVDLGIDRLIVSRHFETNIDDSGRIAPNTALCFTLISLALLLRAIRRRNDWSQTVISFASFTISAAALIGYFIALNSAHDWITGTRMSLQTALCFMCLSLTNAFHRGPRPGIYRSVLGGLMAISTYLILLTFTYVELVAIEALYLLPIGVLQDRVNPRFTLSALVIISGVIYVALVAYLFITLRRGRRVEHALADQQGRLSAVVDAAVDGIVVIDRRGRILSVNPACTRFFGYQASEMLGQNVSMLMPEPYVSAHDDYIKAYERTGVARIIGIGREVEGRRKDGSVFPIDLSVVRIDLPDGTIYSGTLRDISERRASERALIAANAELEEFAYRTSHDLRAPIASAMGMTAIARDMLARNDTERLDETLARMETGFQRLDGLIQNIMQLTRTRLASEDDETIAFATMVRDTLETLNHMDGYQSINFRIEIDPELTIVSKPSRVRIAIGNLLSNAIKYRDLNVTDAKVEISAERVGGVVIFTVDDNGIGIEPEMRANLFRMFVRFAPGHAFGSGLGLYIVKKSVEAIGGSVVYQPREVGSRFILVLPDKAWEASAYHENPVHSGR